MAEIKVFCLHCGQHIECDEGYCGRQINCPTCKQSFFIPQAQQSAPSVPAPPPHAEPAPTIRRRQRPDYLTEAKEWEPDELNIPRSTKTEEIPALWNPYAAARWSLLFSPIFGAIIHARNADALGRTNEATANRVWFYVSLFSYLALIVAGCFANPQDEAGLNGIGKIMWAVLLFGWFYHVGKKQEKYVKKDLAQNYQKKSWLMPLTVAFGISIPLLLAASYDSFSKAKQIAESEQQQPAQAAITDNHTPSQDVTPQAETPPVDPATGLPADMSQLDPNTGLPLEPRIASLMTNDTHTAAQDNAILDFAFEGIKIGDTFASVKQKFPKMGFNLGQWEIDSSELKTADDAMCFFQSNRLVEIDIAFDGKNYPKWKTIYQELVAKYGKEDDSNEPDNHTWYFASANRVVNCEYNQATDNLGQFGHLDVHELTWQGPQLPIDPATGLPLATSSPDPTTGLPLAPPDNTDKIQKEQPAATKNSDGPVTIEKLKSMAEQGDADAQFHLAFEYVKGDLLAKDVKAGLFWYRKAADNGHAEAQGQLGLLYEYGEGVPRNYQEALKWYRSAANQGDAFSQSRLGDMYTTGTGVPKNITEGVNWYRKSAAQGYPLAQLGLGCLYADGTGVPRDNVEAYSLVSLAAAQGVEHARETLDTITARMTPDQIAMAQQRAASFIPKKINQQ